MYDCFLFKKDFNMRLVLLLVSILWSLIGFSQNIALLGAGDSISLFSNVYNSHQASRVNNNYEVAAVRSDVFNIKRHTSLARRLDNKNTHYLMENRHKRLLKEFVWQQASRKNV